MDAYYGVNICMNFVIMFSCANIVQCGAYPEDLLKKIVVRADVMAVSCDTKYWD